MWLVCSICGTIFEHTGQGRRPMTCSPECFRERQQIQRSEYWEQNKDKLNQKRVEKKKLMKARVKKPKNHSMAELNEMARERHLSYGQMQGVLYCEAHPIRPNGGNTV